MTATRLWYPRYVRDFKAKTGHLSLAEKGAYSSLIDEYWERQAPLPSDEKTLCRLLGAFPDEWDDVRENVLAFFDQREGKLHHSRIDEEIANAQEKHAAKTKRMAEARAKRWAKENQSTDQIVDQSTDQISDAKNEQITSTHTHSQSHTHKNQEPRGGAPSGASPNVVENVSCETIKKQKTASRLADDWRPPPEFLAFALVEGFSEMEAKREADKFRDYWVAQAGAKGRKLDWLATWRNWIRRASDDKPSRTNSNNGRGNGRIVDPVEIGMRLVREAEDQDAFPPERQAISGS